MMCRERLESRIIFVFFKIIFIIVLGCPSSDRALTGCEMSRHQHPPGWNQEGPAGARKAWSSGEVLPRPASGSGADQSNVCWPLHFRDGKRITHATFFEHLRLYIKPDVTTSCLVYWVKLGGLEKFFFFQFNEIE